MGVEGRRWKEGEDKVEERESGTGENEKQEGRIGIEATEESGKGREGDREEKGREEKRKRTAGWNRVKAVSEH